MVLTLDNDGIIQKEATNEKEDWQKLARVCKYKHTKVTLKHNNTMQSNY